MTTLNGIVFYNIKQEIRWTQISIELLIWKEETTIKSSLQVYKEKRQHGIFFQNISRAPCKATEYSNKHKYAFALKGRSFQVSLLVLYSTATETPHLFKHVLKHMNPLCKLFLGLFILWFHAKINICHIHSTWTYLPDKCQAQWSVLRQYRLKGLKVTLP